LQLQEYNLRVKHVSGASDFIANTLSRNPSGLNESELEGLTQPRVFMVSVINIGIDHSVGQKIRDLSAKQAKNLYEFLN
jgi:hypothetical protein